MHLQELSYQQDIAFLYIIILASYSPYTWLQSLYLFYYNILKNFFQFIFHYISYQVHVRYTIKWRKTHNFTYYKKVDLMWPTDFLLLHLFDPKYFDIPDILYLKLLSSDRPRQTFTPSLRLHRHVHHHRIERPFHW